MNRTERLYRIDQLLHQRSVVTRNDLLAELEISWATLKRDLAYMRDRLNAPIVFDNERGGYCFDLSGAGPQYELPGLWFNSQEILALLTMHRLLEGFEVARRDRVIGCVGRPRPHEGLSAARRALTPSLRIAWRAYDRIRRSPAASAIPVGPGPVADHRHAPASAGPSPAAQSITPGRP